MTRILAQGRAIDLSYSTNVHPAESAGELERVLREHVAPVSRAAFGERPAAVNLRLGMRQAGELLDVASSPENAALSDALLAAAPTETCRRLMETLEALKLRVVSVNAFPLLDFHAGRVKERVYDPPWSDEGGGSGEGGGARSSYTLKIAKILTHLMGARKRSCVSVPTGAFKGRADRADEALQQYCAAGLAHCAAGLARLERLTGKTVVLGLEPEPCTTGETLVEFLDYYQHFILAAARHAFPAQLGITKEKSEALARKFITVNLDLCHQAVEFEDPLDDLKRLRAAGIAVSGLHLSAALKLPAPGENAAARRRLLALDEPRYLHQVVAKRRDGRLLRFCDLPELKGQRLEAFEELRCHFHVPLFQDFSGPLASTRDAAGPAARFAAREGLTDNFVVETYTWGVLAGLAKAGNEGARAIVGRSEVDLNAGLVKELQWARAELEQEG